MAINAGCVVIKWNHVPEYICLLTDEIWPKNAVGEYIDLGAQHTVRQLGQAAKRVTENEDALEGFWAVENGMGRNVADAAREMRQDLVKIVKTLEEQLKSEPDYFSEFMKMPVGPAWWQLREKVSQQVSPPTDDEFSAYMAQQGDYYRRAISSQLCALREPLSRKTISFHRENIAALEVNEDED
ncbi:hypothetical protein B9Z65_5929 [Elsinoe australis]|uniref:Uncharacterized protein n=1 Tax=Elsinoe australis TaxID=40998 RepID=A0A2P7YJH1_9PEZI|nr:hypothetical protein B9Z65_5929 [Elsinoe australis]